MTLNIVLHLFNDATNVWSDRELPIADCVSSDQVIDIALKHAEMDDLVLTHIRATSPFVTSFQPVQVFRQRLHREYRLRRIGEYAAQATEAMGGLSDSIGRIGTVFHEFMERTRELGFGDIVDSATTPPPSRNDPTPVSAMTPPPRFLYVGPNRSSWMPGPPELSDPPATDPAQRTLEMFGRPLAGMSRDAANAMRAALRADQLDSCDACNSYRQRNTDVPWVNHRLDGR